MTNREFYEMVVSTSDNEELVAHATEAIAKIDATNAKRSAKNAEKAQANVALAEAIIATLTDEPQTATDIASKFSCSPQKVASVLSRSGLPYGKAKIKDGKAVRVGYIAE